MKEQILALLEEVKGKLIIELQKKENFESEKQQLLQEIQSLNAQIAELHAQIAQFEAQDAEILARAQEMNDMLDGSMPPPPPPILYLNSGTPRYIGFYNDDLVFQVYNGEVSISSNSGIDDYTATINDKEYIISTGENELIGTVSELNGSLLTIRNNFTNNTQTYQLIA